MSNARSPRDVCSTTIGISGLMSPPSLPGVHIFIPVGAFSFSGVQSFSRARASSIGIRSTRFHDLVECLAHPQVAAQLLEARALARGDEQRVRILAGLLRLLADECLDLLVRDLEAELVGDGVEGELALQRLLGLGAEPRDDLVRVCPVIER